MIHYTNFVMAGSLDEAYELNKKKSSVICGGFCWLRLQNRTIQMLIDLSGLGLEKIEETKEQFEIGCMATLRSLETHEGLNRWAGGAFADSVRHIVGTQFRNCATVGGSIYGRFGFSDVLTLFLALDAQVKLYKAGVMPLRDFLDRKEDGDILVSVLVRKGQARISYESMRNEAVDFPVLTAAVCERGDKTTVSIGARPARAAAVTVENGYFAENVADRKAAAEKLIESLRFGTNMRASAQYRKYLAGVLLMRCLDRIDRERSLERKGGNETWN